MGVLSIILASFLAAQDKVKITVEYDEVPDVKEWAEKARDLCEKWYPIISETLAGKDFIPPRDVRIVFKDEKKGIADYVRYFKYEPKPTPPKVSSKANYKDGYKTSATFLAWMEKTKDKDIVRKLNDLLRTGKYKEEVFKEWTGSDLETLWKDFIAAQG